MRGVSPAGGCDVYRRHAEWMTGQCARPARGPSGVQYAAWRNPTSRAEASVARPDRATQPQITGP